jgi:FkbH-like protein
VNITFLEKDLDWFSRVSGDSNPLHMKSDYAARTAYGRRVAFGILGGLAVLAGMASRTGCQPSSIQMEFRHPVFPGRSYRVVVRQADGNTRVAELCDDEAQVVRVSIEYDAVPAIPSMTDLQAPRTPSRRHTPAVRDLSEIARAGPVEGAYQCERRVLEEGAPQWMARAVDRFGIELMELLMCTSYLVGMELPGQRALFSKLDLSLGRLAQRGDQLVNFTLAPQFFNDDFGLLQMQLRALHGEGLAASGRIAAFARRDVALPEPKDVAAYLLCQKDALEGRTALVTGGSRGLGAALVQGLSMRGCHVYLVYRDSQASAEKVVHANPTYAADITLFRGDVADPVCCGALAELVQRERGGLDILVCNAATAPSPMPGSHHEPEWRDYIESNFSITQTPLKLLTPLVQQRAGIVVAVSSVFVEERPAAFAHYVALKERVEAEIHRCAERFSEVSFLIPRAPRMLTEMSNTPQAMLGARPAAVVAAAIVDGVANCRCSGEVRVMPASVMGGETGSASLEKPAQAPPPKAVVAATFSAELLSDSLNFWARQLELPLQLVQVEYNQVFQQLLDPDSTLASNRVGVNVVMVRAIDWLRDFNDPDLQMQRAHLREVAEEFRNAVLGFVGRSPVPFCLLICPSGAPEGLVDTLVSVESDLSALQHRAASMGVLAASDYHTAYAVADYLDPLRDQLGHIPYTPEYYHLLGTLVMRFYHSVVSKPYKVIVCDCDNTLWEGVCGEEGPEGVRVHRHFERLQRLVRTRVEQGVLLCLCSKNHQDDVHAVFKHRQDGCLGLEHCTDMTINWSSKSANLRELAQRLNLSLDSFIFIDDSPLECAEVRANCPEILTIQWPADEAEAEAVLNHTWAFDRFVVTEEDRRRLAMYRAEQKRERLQGRVQDYREFIESLALKVEIRPPQQDELARASQLMYRTNQFNFTRRCYSAPEVAALSQGDPMLCQVVQVSDRFGDYGLVGVLMCKAKDNQLVLENFLLSCRVLGRGVEHRMLAHVGHMAVQRSWDEVVIEFRPMEKNEPARRFLQEITEQDISTEVELSLLTMSSRHLAEVRFAPPSKPLPGSIDHHSPSATAVVGQQPYHSQLFRRLGSLTALGQSVNTATDHASRTAQTDQSVLVSTPEPDPEHDRKAVEYRVAEVFSDILDVPGYALDFDAELDQIVADSYKVVELTVALKRIYSELPATFLYEYRSLREIVDALAGGKPKASGTDFPRAVEQESDNRPRVSPVSSPVDAIAIVGMSCRFPGADDPDAFWELLKQGRSVLGAPPEDRWGMTGDTIGAEVRAGFIADADRFDAGLFNISPREALYMDPQQRLFLESVWALLEDAGYTRHDLARDSGVFVGIIANDYGVYAGAPAASGEVPYRWTDYYQVANRISYFFDLHGPSLAVDTACSSSGTAIHLACESLRKGECSTAIAGGVNLFLHPSRFVQYRQMGIISESGLCRPFGRDADGTMYGEGIGALLLKPLHLAERDGDRIHGVIRATAMNAGGRTNGFTIPNPQAQADLIGTAIERSGIDAGTIGYIEAHGTGTSLGDPIEVRGLSQAFAEHTRTIPKTSQYCGLGSLKANIGHLESAAAVAGVIKVLLQMRSRQLAPSLHAQCTNPMIEFGETPFRVQHELAEWQAYDHRTPRRAGVSSFGAGGSNTHLVLEEYQHPGQYTRTEPVKKLLPFSARDRDSLRSLVERLCAYLDKEPSDETDLLRIAYTLQVGREPMQQRLAVIAATLEELVERLRGYLDGNIDQNSVFEGLQDARFARVFQMRDADPLWDSLSDTPSEAQLQRLALLWVNGAEFAWRSLYSDAKPRPLSLPTYPFGGRSYYLPREFGRFVADVKPENPLLGQRLESPFVEGSLYTARYDLRRLSYLREHRIHDRLIVPGALYLALATTIAVREGADYPCRLHDVTFLKAIDVTHEDGVEVQSQWRGQTGSIEIAARRGDEDGWQIRCTLTRGCGSDNLDMAPSLEQVRERCPEAVSREAFYTHGASLGFHWSGGFRGIQSLWRGNGTALAMVRLPESLELDMQHCEVHPAFLDACFQPFVAALDEQRSAAREPYLPLGVESVCFHRRPPRCVWAHANMLKVNHQRSVTFDIFLYDEAGNLCAEFRRMNALRTSSAELHDADSSQGAPRDWLYETTWEKITLDETALSAPRRRLVINAGDRATPQLVDMLKSEGDEVVGIDASQSVGQMLEAFDAVLPGLGEASIILDLPAFEERPGEDSILDHINQVWDLLHGVVTRLVDTPSCKAKLWLLTHNAQAVDGSESAASLLSGAIWGLGRCLAWEHREFWGGMLDLSSRSGNSRVRVIRSILDGIIDEDQLALREADGCYVGRLKPLQSAGETNNVEVHRQATYLVSGGLGSLGRLHTEWLIARGAATLMLIGRSAADAEARQWLDRLRVEGADVHYRQVDVGDRKQLAMLLQEMQQSLPPLRGVLHIAGCLDDGLFINQSQRSLQSVFRPKAAGAWYLHRLTMDSALDFFITTSTSSVLLGAPGQTNYVLANAFMDALAQYRQHMGQPALSVNWGPWKGTRMVSMARGGRKQSWTGADFGVITTDRAESLFETVFVRDRVEIAVLPFHWEALIRSLTDQPLPSLLKSFGASAAYEENSSRIPAQVDSEQPTPHSVEAIEQRLIGLINRLLGYDEENSFNSNASFHDIGLDSMTAVRLRNEVNTAFNLSLPATSAFDYPSVPSFAAHLAHLLPTPTEVEIESRAPVVKRDREPQAPLPSEIHCMSEQEANAALERELMEVGNAYE